MNELHLKACAGPEWAETVRDHIVPWTTRGVDLGDHLLEVGPGPGATTDVLRLKVPHLTAVEVDADLAGQLRARLAGSNVTVVEGDATALPFPDGHFDSAICLTMLHHVATVELQDQLLSELARVVRPGGPVIGTDSLDSPGFREFHEGDVCVPLDPEGLAERLGRLGMHDVAVETNPYAFKFVARAG